MNLKPKQVLTIISALIIVVVVSVWLFLGGTDHIEDTNGSEDVSLQTITDKTIIDRSIGSVVGPSISQSILTGETVEFSSEKFTGVYEILYDDFIAPSDFSVNLTAYDIYAGNFKSVVHNEEIVAALEPGLFVEYLLEDVTGHVSLRITGESASFSFCMTETEYDYHAHTE